MAVNLSEICDVPKALERYVALHIEEEKLIDKCKSIRARITENYYKALLTSKDKYALADKLDAFKRVKKDLKETIHEITMAVRKRLIGIPCSNSPKDLTDLASCVNMLLPSESNSEEVNRAIRTIESPKELDKESADALRGALLTILNALKVHLIDFKLEQISKKLTSSDKAGSVEDWAKSYKELEDKIRCLSFEDYSLEELLLGLDKMVDSIGDVLERNSQELEHRYVSYTIPGGQRGYRSLSKKVKDELLVLERHEKKAERPLYVSTGDFPKEFSVKKEAFTSAVRSVVLGGVKGYVTTTETGLLLKSISDLVNICKLNNRGFKELAEIPQIFAKEKLKPCNLLSRDWFKFRGKIDLREEKPLSEIVSSMLKAFLSKEK